MSAEEKSINLTPEELLEEHEWWKGIICNQDGSLSPNHVLQELHDFRFIMHEASVVYDHVTCGAMSKPTYFAVDVNAQADQCDEHYIRLAVVEALNRVMEGELISDLIEEFAEPE